MAFLTLRHALCEPPILGYPDYNRPFIVSTDASSHAIGAVLEQKDEDGRLHPVSFVSRTLSQPEQNYSVTDKEAVVVIFALKKFRHYLLPRPFDLYTEIGRAHV